MQAFLCVINNGPFGVNEFLHDEMSLKDAHEIRVRLTVKALEL